MPRQVSYNLCEEMYGRKLLTIQESVKQMLVLKLLCIEKLPGVLNMYACHGFLFQ